MYSCLLHHQCALHPMIIVVVLIMMIVQQMCLPNIHIYIPMYIFFYFNICIKIDKTSFLVISKMCTILICLSSLNVKSLNLQKPYFTHIICVI
ncbi:hypothetical protein XELAEV_18039866mg [Xenopus laevis]|uniref:Uncharacterized protein n=1 Tax=Xenopus laevis TaxID=8355 RepID=A0A974C9L1_XENLA|nr:hypothetical protein XELAEV_18039866mg [Xenopus laevis]